MDDETYLLNDDMTPILNNVDKPQSKVDPGGYFSTYSYLFLDLFVYSETAPAYPVRAMMVLFNTATTNDVYFTADVDPF